MNVELYMRKKLQKPFKLTPEYIKVVFYHIFVLAMDDVMKKVIEKKRREIQCMLT